MIELYPSFSIVGDFMEIRYITEDDDFSPIREIYEKSWKFAYRDIVPMDYMNSIPKGRWGGKFMENGRNDIGAFIDGRIVGTASFCASRWDKFYDYGEIVTIYLLPEFIGKGVGSALIEWCITELKIKGFKRILLWVLEENLRARRFYENHHFKLTDEYMDDNLGGRDVREIMYCLDID